MTLQVGAFQWFSINTRWTVAESAHLACLPSPSISILSSSSSMDMEDLPWPVWDNKSDYSACRHLQWVGCFWINKITLTVFHQITRGWWAPVRGDSLIHSLTYLLHWVLHQLGGSHHGHHHLLLFQVCHIQLCSSYIQCFQRNVVFEKQDTLQLIPNLHPSKHLLDHHRNHAEHPLLQQKCWVILVYFSHLPQILPSCNLLLDVCGRYLWDIISTNLIDLASFHYLCPCILSCNKSAKYSNIIDFRPVLISTSDYNLFCRKFPDEVSSLLLGWLG